MNLEDLVHPIRRGLRGLRTRVRGLLLMLGAGRLTVFLGTALVLLFGLDYALRLPLSVRAVLLALMGLGAGTVLVRHMLRPLLRDLPDETLAAVVERAHPRLNDRLRSSLAFATAEKDPENEDSRDLMRAVVEETVRETATIPFARVAAARIPGRWAAAACAVALLLGTAAAARPDLASIFLRRSLLLRQVSWPRRTTLVVDGMEPGVPSRVTMGREATIRIRAEGSAPDRVRFTFWETSAGPAQADEIDLTPAADDASLFAFTLKVYASYQFTVTGGDDDRADTYTIEALTPPSVLGIQMDATYPEYLGRPPATLEGGGQRVPQGTKLKVRVHTNLPLREASVMVGTDEPTPMELAKPDVAVFDVAADRNIRYALRLVGANGEENDPGADTFLLQVVQDQPPSIRVRTPAAQSEYLAAGVVLVAFAAQDDYSVESVTFKYKINDEPEHRVNAGESGGDAIRGLVPAERTDTEIRGVFSIDLSRLPRTDGKLIDKGDKLTFSLEARDSGGRTRETRSPQRVDIVGDEELTQILQGRQQELRETVRRADERARDTSEKIALARDVSNVPQEFRHANALAQASQGRVLEQLETLAPRVGNVVNLYVFNRLGDRSAAEQILPFYERHLLAPSEASAPPFRGELYHELWRAFLEKRIRLGDAQMKLFEMAFLADNLAADDGPRAYRALGRAGSSADPNERAAALTEADTALRAILEGLDKLARLMQEWENYEGVISRFKGLRETEQGIVDELRKEAK
ncbi:MAG TPA: hypothetical protein VFY93_11455 [Planctomycetota bacterium]|nr:hypothetical protein [Planctomycetota bacterium]